MGQGATISFKSFKFFPFSPYLPPSGTRSRNRPVLGKSRSKNGSGSPALMQTTYIHVQTTCTHCTPVLVVWKNPCRKLSKYYATNVFFILSTLYLICLWLMIFVHLFKNWKKSKFTLFSLFQKENLFLFIFEK